MRSTRLRSQISESNGPDQRRGIEASRDPRRGGEVALRSSPALDLDREQLARLDQLGDPAASTRPPGGGSSRAGRARRRPRGDRAAIRTQLALGVGERRGRRRQHRRRQHPLGQVVEALEAPPARRRSPARTRTATRARAWSPTSPTTGRCAAGARRSAPRRRSGRGRGPARAPRRPARGCSSAIRRIPPQASSPARSIRQRSSGCSSTGSSEASWPQYSNSRRGARCESRSSSSCG